MSRGRITRLRVSDWLGGQADGRQAFDNAVHGRNRDDSLPAERRGLRTWDVVSVGFDFERADTDPAPVVKVHEFQQAMMQDECGDDRESPPEVREVSLGQARLSTFTASEGFSSIAGYRMTVLNNLKQYNIVCKCPKSKLKEYDPIFQHVLGSFVR